MPQDGLIGTLLASVFGYQDAPTVGEVIVYFAYLIPALILFFSPPRPEPVARAAPQPLQDLTHSPPARPIREETHAHSRTTRLRLALFGGAALLSFPATLGGQAFGQADAAPIAPGPIVVTLTDAGCDPAKVEVAAGKSTFSIKNESKRAVEWEILKDVRVVAERENILPGFAQTITATLDAGDYAMTCGSEATQGNSTVAATSEAPAKPSPMDLVGPIAEYKVYVKGEVDILVAETRKLTDAVKAGKLAEAQKVYAPAHQHYERIEPIAELFNDLDGSIDSREDDFEKKADDPKFTGFHRLEKGLFTDKSTAGLPRSRTS